VAFDETLAEEIRRQLQSQTAIVEKRMFGGVGFLVNGNMSVGVYKDELIVRLPPDETEAALKKPGARIFDITGRPMKGWLMIGRTGLQKPKTLEEWIRRGVLYASTLPKKK
jgi:TfoX/Sxy family transcriptional regulator of competence genes